MKPRMGRDDAVRRLCAALRRLAESSDRRAPQALAEAQRAARGHPSIEGVGTALWALECEGNLEEIRASAERTAQNLERNL